MSSIPQLPVPGWVALLRKPPALFLLVGIVVVALLIYFQVDKGAIATGVIVFAVAAAVFYAGIAFTRRKERRDVDAAIGGMTDSIVAQDNTPQARERVSKLRAKWDSWFRDAKIRPEYLKSKPILMIVGESKSGKSCLLDRCGLELESDNRQERDWEAGTENVDPWFFPEGLVFDTAGEMVVQETGGARVDWPVLVGLIKKLRPRNPVSGVVLAVPVWRLLSADEASRARQASLFQREFQRLVQGFGVRFPVSVVVTMADLIDGYADFAKLQNVTHQGDSYTMLGWPQYELPNEFGARDAVVESVAGIGARVEAQVLHDVCNPDSPPLQGREALEIWNFPKSIREVGKRLTEYLRIVFKEKESERLANAPFFRGLFFGSALQTIRREEPRRKEPERPASEPFHVRDLLSIRLFGEAGLVTTSGRAEAAIRYRRMLGIGVPLGVAAVSAAVALVALSLAQRVSTGVDAYRKLAWAVNRYGADQKGLPRVQPLKTDWLEEGVAKPAECAELDEALTNARKFDVELPVWLSWYSWAVRDKKIEAKAAVDRAWEILVAQRLLNGSAEQLRDGKSRYRTLPFETDGGVNPELVTLDRQLVATLAWLAPLAESTAHQATDATPSVSPSEEYNLQLRSSAKTPAGDAAETKSLRCVFDAIRTEADEQPDDDVIDRLLEIPDGWAAAETSQIQTLRTLLATERSLALVDRVRTEIAPILDAVDAHLQWRPNPDKDAREMWTGVATKVWDACLLVDRTKDPAARLRAVAGYLDGLSGDANDKIVGMLMTVTGSGEGDAKRAYDAATKLAEIAKLHERHGGGADVVALGTKLATFAETISDPRKSKYERGKLGTLLAGRFALSAREAPDKPSEDLRKRAEDLQRYLQPLVDDADDAIRAFLGGSVRAISESSGTTPSPEWRDGIFLPLRDIGTVVSGAEIAAIQADKSEVERWRGALSRSAREFASWEQAAVAALGFLDTPLNKIASSAKDWKVLDLGRIEPVPDATTWIAAILGHGKKTVADVKDELAKQATALSVCRRDSAVAEKPLPAADESRKAIQDALDKLVATQQPTSPDLVQRVSWDLGHQAKADPTFGDALRGLSYLPADERAYWERFWRELLVCSVVARQFAADKFEERLASASQKFPISPLASAELSARELSELGSADESVLPTGLTLDAARIVAVRKAVVGKRLDQIHGEVTEAPQKDSEAGHVDSVLAALRIPSGQPNANGGSSLVLSVQMDGEPGPGAPEEAADGAWAGKWADVVSDVTGDHGIVRLTSGASAHQLGGRIKGFEWSGTIAPAGSTDRVALTFAECKIGSKEREELPLGTNWPILRLVRAMMPLKNGATEFTVDKEGGYWGVLSITRSPAESLESIVVLVRIEMAWVDPSGKRTPVDINAWLKAVNGK